jgi:hypothetical protein
MPRARRQWSLIRADIRNLLRETTAGLSFWTDAELLLYANLCQDLRVIQMMETHEGWFTDRFEANLVAGQAEYTVPEGTDRIKRVLLRFPDENLEIPLMRHERWSEPVQHTGAMASGTHGSLPTYRMVGELLFLEPRPTVSRTNGLLIELEGLPARLVDDTSKLDLKFPSMIETLLTMDVWDVAMGVEDAQGNIDPQVAGRLKAFHQKVESAFAEAVALRTHGRVFSMPFNLGD